MAVDHAERRGLGAQMFENARQHDMLVHVGEVAGMESVLIIHLIHFAAHGVVSQARTSV